MPPHSCPNSQQQTSQGRLPSRLGLRREAPATEALAAASFQHAHPLSAKSTSNPPSTAVQYAMQPRPLTSPASPQAKALNGKTGGTSSSTPSHSKRSGGSASPSNQLHHNVRFRRLQQLQHVTASRGAESSSNNNQDGSREAAGWLQASGPLSRAAAGTSPPRGVPQGAVPTDTGASQGFGAPGGVAHAGRSGQLAASMSPPGMNGAACLRTSAGEMLLGVSSGSNAEEEKRALTHSTEGLLALGGVGGGALGAQDHLRSSLCVLPKGWGGGKQAWLQQKQQHSSAPGGAGPQGASPLFLAQQWDSTSGAGQSTSAQQAGGEEAGEGEPCFMYGSLGSKCSGPLLRGPAPQTPPATSPALNRDKGLEAVATPPQTAPSKFNTEPSRLNGTSHGLLVDLIEATRKSFAAGLGEWDLQAVEWGHPQFKQRLLKGPLGPETLKARYGLKEPEQLKLYRVLYSYTVGFCDAVDEPTTRAHHREELLELVFKAYAQLWDEALGVAFSSEMVAAANTKNAALASAADLQAQLQTAQAENGHLQRQLAQYAKGNIDNMLVQRMDTDKARTTEGEVHMLARAADTLSLKLAGAEAKQEGLVLAAQEAHSRMEAAEARAQELLRQTAKLKEALKEQQTVSTRLAARIRDADQQLSASNKERMQLAAELKVHKARLTPIERPKSELELALADKTRAYSLLHTDFVVKMAELDETRHQNRELREKVEEMHATFDSASQRITLAQAEKERFRHKWESNCMYTEDLEATNARMSLRNHELVRAYWPLMSHLREVEARCETLEAEREKAMEVKARLVEQVTTQQEQLQRAALYKQRMRGLEATLAAAEAAGEVPPALLAELAPESAERLRAFVRGANMRVEGLTTQLVHLVDVHASSSADLQQYRVLNRELHRQVKALDQQNKELEAHFMRQVTRVAAQAASEVAEELAGLQHEDERMSRSQAQEEKAGAPATPVSYMAKIASLRLQMQELEERMDLVQRVRTANENRIAVLEDERDAALSECASRDKWLYEVCNQAEALHEQVVRLLARDPNAPTEASRFAPGSSLLPKAPNAPLLAPLPQAASAGDSRGQQTSLPSGSAAGGRPEPSGAGAEAESKESGGGQSVEPASQHAVGQHQQGKANSGVEASRERTSPSPLSGTPARAEVGAGGSSSSPGRSAKEGVPYKVPQQAHGSRTIMLGRLAVRVGSASETCRSLVAVDRCWESMSNAVERMVQWGSGLVTNPVQITQLQQLQAQSVAITAAKQKDQEEIQALKKRVEEAEQKLQATTQTLKLLEQQVVIITGTSETAQSGRAAFESALNGARQELEQLHARHARMEREYWAIKAQLLDAELHGGEAVSARDRAVKDAQKAMERMQRAEKETAEHRHQRKQLEADVVGLKAWVRTMQGTERAYRELLVELAQSQDKLELAEKATAALQERMTAQSNQLEAARHQVSLLASQLQESTAQALDERKGGAAADQAVKTAAAAQVASAEEGRGLAERRAADAEDRHAAAASRLASTESQLASVTAEASSLRQELFNSQQQVVRLQALLPQIASGTQAIERKATNMEGRIGALGAQIARLGAATGTKRAQDHGAGGGGQGEGGKKQQGSLLAACHALADCAEGMADAIERTLESAGSHSGAHEQIEVLVRMEGLVNDLMGLLNSSSGLPPATAQAPPSSAPPASSTPAAPSTPAGCRRARLAAPQKAVQPAGPPGSSWSAPAGGDETVEAGEEQPSLAASVVALQVSLASARAEAAEAREADQAHRAACMSLERQLEAAAAVAKQHASMLEQLEHTVREQTQEALAMQAALDAAASTRKAAEEAARSLMESAARAEKERDDALEQAKVAIGALEAERDAVARLQRVCAEMASAAIHTDKQSVRPRAEVPDAQGMDTLLQLASARAERADALARWELADKVAKAAVADAAAARTAAAQAAETARNAEVARLEVISLLAEARRAHEGVQDMVRHAEAEAARVLACMAEVEKDAVQERERADMLSCSLLNLQVEVRAREGERALALGALVDENVAPVVRAALLETAAAGNQPAQPPIS